MRAPAEALVNDAGREAALQFERVRLSTTELCGPLAIEDYVVQSMPDASPIKWHLAHTTWFFERFILTTEVAGYQPYHASYDYLFNSYYQTVGTMHPRASRGLLSRPTVEEIFNYRQHVDAAVRRLLQEPTGPECHARLLLGINHEQQHQELMLTDIKHAFSLNPLQPAYTTVKPVVACAASSMRFMEFAASKHEVGHGGAGFCFDNETSKHSVFTDAFALANRPVTNEEYAHFIRDDGYRRPTLWLADGWSMVSSERWARPLYWSEDLGAEFTLAGSQPLRADAPVCHLSYYEADAFARWAGARLPMETEWERAASSLKVEGNFLERGELHPRGAPALGTSSLQMFGNVWEWTASAYHRYPRYRPAAGALGEYNGKFMCNQFVLRGGSCVTPQDHMRASYRNFFPPHSRWQFSGVRLARDI